MENATTIGLSTESYSNTSFLGVQNGSTSSVAEGQVARGVTYILASALSPTLLTIGIVGNILIIIVLQRGVLPGIASTLSFTWLAAADLLTLVNGLTDLWLYATNSSITIKSVIWCKLQSWLLYSAITLSSWCIVFITIQRIMAVTSPLRNKIFATKRNTLIGLISMTVIIFAMNSHMLFAFGHVTLPGDTDGPVFCDIITPYHQFFIVWTWVDLFLASVVPFVIVIVGNCVIIVCLLRARRERQHMARGRKEGKGSSVAGMLLGVSVMFIICTLPVVVLQIGSRFWFNLRDEGDYARWQMATFIANVIQYVNNTASCLLYTCTSKDFRKKVFELFTRRKVRATGRSSVTTATGSTVVSQSI